VLQFENVIGMVEGLPHETEPHRVNAWEHNQSLYSARASLLLWRNIVHMPSKKVNN